MQGAQKTAPLISALWGNEMAEPETFNVIDDGLNSRLDELSTTLENTRKTLETVTGDLIAAQDRQSRRQNFLQVIYLALTLFIALSASASTYFAYQSITISSGQKTLQSTQLMLNTVKDVFDILKYFAENADKDQAVEETKDATNVNASDKNVKNSSKRNGGNGVKP